MSEHAYTQSLWGTTMGSLGIYTLLLKQEHLIGCTEEEMQLVV